MKLDIFNHIFPKTYYERMLKEVPNPTGINKRVRHIPAIVDLKERFRKMDLFGEYAQVICLPNPPIETLGPPRVCVELAKMGNDGMAELVSKHPARFPGFVAGLAMNDPDAMLKEAERAIKKLGAVGVQVFTNVLGKPLTAPETMPLFDLMAKLDLPIWLHPARTEAFPDYQKETKSPYEIWWTFGWPYETSVAMARIVFAGLFDKHPDLKIITHHLGAMVPYFEGRVGPGCDQIGTRSSDGYERLVKRLKKRPVDYFHMFYADTAVFGAWEATKCGLKFFGVDRVLFASDAPFDPEKGSMYTRTTIEIIDRLDISPEERQKIYEGNARRIMRLN
ncbi:MAG: amidohydrolase [Betaproteobacteria bacterium]|nr:amidohydrolase [Betaproteobacteria bacterium]MBI2959569.1 amidohydrolase [Betaproteobacteria bacterium]